MTHLQIIKCQNRTKDTPSEAVLNKYNINNFKIAPLHALRVKD